MILSDIYKTLCAQLEEQEARFLIAHYAGLEWADVIARPEFELDEDVVQSIEAAAGRRKGGEPLSRILGQAEFWGMAFRLSPDTLDPRADTEVLVERALRHFGDSPPSLILDLGTGSGCIPIALLKEWPDSRAVAVDLSLGALEVARENARAHGVAERISFLCGSWGESLGGEFELIVSNPPYIESAVIENLDAEVRNHDPILALDGGEDGLEAYKRIFCDISALLKKSGRAFVEIGYDQGDNIMRLGEKYRIRVEGVFPDYAGRARVVDISCGDK